MEGEDLFDVFDESPLLQVAETESVDSKTPSSAKPEVSKTSELAKQRKRPAEENVLKNGNRDEKSSKKKDTNGKKTEVKPVVSYSVE